MASSTPETFSLPLWEEVLQTAQLPSALLIESAFRTHRVIAVTVTLPQEVVVYTAQLLIILMQAGIFALLAFAALEALCSVQSSKSWRLRRGLLRKRILSALFLPPAILILLNTAWPSLYLLSDNETNVLMIASAFWLVLAALVIGTLAVTWRARQTS